MNRRPSEVYAQALAGVPIRLRYADGPTVPLDAARWAAAASASDARLLALCDSATLDVGCGPGRMLAALRDAGVRCAGVDVTAGAVALARGCGAAVLHASVFDRALDGTRWGTVLLADGNIGIGGDPVALLRRSATLLVPGGTVLTEVDPPGSATRRVRVRLEDGVRSSSWFPWAHVAVGDLATVAAAAGLSVAERWCDDGRWFAALVRVPGATATAMAATAATAATAADATAADATALAAVAADGAAA